MTSTGTTLFLSARFLDGDQDALLVCNADDDDVTATDARCFCGGW